MNQEPNPFQNFQTPSQPSPAATPPPQAPKKSNKKLWLILGSFLAVVIIAVGVAVLFSLLNTPATDDETNNTPATLSAAEQLVTDARATISESTNPATGFITIEGEINEAPVFARPAQMVNNDSFAVFPEASYGFAVNPEDETLVTAIETSLQAFLAARSLERTDFLGEASTDEAYSRYASTDVICAVYRLNAVQQESVETQATVSLGCANSESYEASATVFTPYVTALQEAENTPDPATNIFDTVTILDSDGIETAEVLIRSYPFGTDGTIITFTREGDGDWSYVQ